MANWGRECRVEFRRPVWGRDGLNNPVILSWSQVAQVWGFLKPVRDGAQEQGAQQVRVSTDRFTVRYRRSIARLPHDAQVLCEGLIYEVTRVEEVTVVDRQPSRREWLMISAAAKPDIGG